MSFEDPGAVGVTMRTGRVGLSPQAHHKKLILLSFYLSGTAYLQLYLRLSFQEWPLSGPDFLGHLDTPEP
jgi:hypothetical protein